MSTRSSALPTDSRFSRGTLVTVLAGCFDDDDGNSDDESHWSGKFKNGSKQELFGVVDNVYATRCDVYFFDDKITTKVNVESLILKADQELVILGDGSEWKREAFSSLVSLDGEKSKTVKTIKSNESSSTFEFNEEHLKIENNRNMKRKVADRDVLVLKVNAAKRPSLVTTTVPETFEMTWPSAVSSSDSQTNPTPSDVATGSSSTQAPLIHASAPISEKMTVPRTRVKKAPLYKRLVKNLVEAEVVSNYESTCQKEHPERELSATIKQGTTKNAPVRTLHFSTKTNTKVRRSECDMIVGKPGPTKEVQHLVEPLQGFDYFFPAELQTKLVSFVNKRIVSTLQSQIKGKLSTGFQKFRTDFFKTPFF